MRLFAVKQAVEKGSLTALKRHDFERVSGAGIFAQKTKYNYE